MQTVDEVAQSLMQYPTLFRASDNLLGLRRFMSIVHKHRGELYGAKT